MAEKEVRKRPQRGKEGAAVSREIMSFDLKESVAWRAIQVQFSSGIRHTELLGVAQVLCQMKALPPISRTCMRSFVALVKWFDDNWESIKDELKRITILDEDSIPITGMRELSELCVRKPPQTNKEK